MRIVLAVDTGTGPVEYRTRWSDLVAWEEHTGRDATDLAKGVGFRDMDYLAWRVSTEHPRPALAEWRDRVVSVDLVGVETVDPTQPAATPARP